MQREVCLGAGGIFGGHFAQLDAFVQIAMDSCLGGGQGGRIHIEKMGFEASSGGDMGDAATHGTGSQNGDMAHFLSHGLLIWTGQQEF